jgi:hypothetical protein
MAKAWKVLDLEGGGLQAANLILARRLKKERWAYFLWLFFPLGAHCLYLEAPRRAALYWVLTLLPLAAAYFTSATIAAVLTLPVLAFALYDLRWIDRRRVELNKQIRMQVYLHQSGGPPAGFRGRYTDDADLTGYLKEKEQERGGHQPVSTRAPGASKRAPSFAEQEAMLRKMQNEKEGKSKE